MVGVLLTLAGCEVRLPSPALSGPGSDVGGGGQGGATATLVVRAEPEAPLGSVTRVLRLHIESALLDPEAIALVRGPVGPGQLRDIRDKQPSSALSERFVPARIWRADDEVIVAPTAPLEPGEVYTLAIGEARETREIRAEGDTPMLSRLWPPKGADTARAFAVWCGEEDDLPFATPTTLAPDGPPGLLLRGAVEGGAGERCLRFEADEDGADGEWAPPPAVKKPLGQTVLLDPAPLSVKPAPDPGAIEPAACAADEIVFGPGCARIYDDRLQARSAGTPLLWAVAGATVDRVIAVGAGDPFVITGLPPATDVVLDVVAIDARGTRAGMLVATVTAAPMPHLILNEVLANPLGPEPDSEWVEIVNDGLGAVDLEGYALSDGGAESVLPPFLVPPGGFVLIVDEGWEQGGSDVPPEAGTPVLRVPHLGKSGLSNSGEALTLLDPKGAVVSRFPASPKPKAGLSVARLAPSLPDGLAASFAVAAPSPGKHNVW